MRLLAGIELTMPSLVDHARQLERELAASRNKALEEAALLVDKSIDPQNAWITGNDIRALKEVK